MAADSSDQLERMRTYYNTGVTRGYDFRKSQLKKLRDAILKYEDELYLALKVDLRKNREESWVTEVGFLVSEISHTLHNLRQWMKPEKVSTNLLNFPSKSYVIREPKGVVLIIAPWNYPLQLLFTPMIGAIASGNCIVLKPSEF